MLFIDNDIYANKMGIYQIKNLKNNKVYIGQTKDRFIERYWNHTWKLNCGIHDNTYLQRAWLKYGSDNFEFSIVNVCDNIDNIDFLEINYIKKYKIKNMSYNISNGGQGKSCPTSEEAKRKIGIKNKNNMTGKKMSQKTKEKMSIQKVGKVFDKKTNVINQQIAYSIKRDLINNKSNKEICENYNIDYNIINNIISNNAWNSVVVEGWDEFLINKPKNLTYETAQEIRYKFNKGYSKEDLMKEYKKSERTIRDIIKNNIYVNN